MDKVPKTVQFMGAVALIYFSYGTSSFVQEKFTTQEYLDENDEKERFSFTFFALLFQCLTSVLTSKLSMILLRLPPNIVPIQSYALVSFTFIAAQFFSFHSLLFVSYPTQVLTKSCKPIPVMIMGIFVMSRKYSLKKYLFVGMMCLGIILFSYNPNQTVEKTTTMTGYLLLSVSLILDGMTGPFQEKLASKYRRNGEEIPSSHLMFYSNVWASFFVGLAMILSGELTDALAFCSRHPEIYSDLFWFGILNAIGQHAIYFIVLKFGALSLTMVTTTRKFFTILWSVIWFGHAVTILQWCGVMFVFAGITLDVLFKDHSKPVTITLNHPSQPQSPLILESIEDPVDKPQRKQIENV